MIPKIIHYCWFGNNPKPNSVLKCIESWKKFCPDYEIKEWNETNFDININLYCKQAYEAKKWAFATDYIRLWVIYNKNNEVVFSFPFTFPFPFPSKDTTTPVLLYFSELHYTF